MAKRNQVTTDLRISADAQLKTSRSFLNQLDKMIDKFDFGDKINNQLSNAKNQLKDYNKVLERVQTKSLISDKELKDLVKAGKEIANIITKTEKLYNNLSSSELQKFSKEYIKQVKAQEAQIAKIKESYTAKTGKNFDKELANYDKIKNKVKELQREKDNLAKTGANDIATKEVEQLNKKLEEQKNKLSEIRKLQKESAAAYTSTVETESQKRGYKNYAEVKNIKISSEDQIRRQLGTAEYKEQASLISTINREIKELEKTKEDANDLDREAISLAKQYKIENVSGLDTLKQQLKIKKDILNSYKGNKSALAAEKAVTAEMEKQKKQAEDIAAIESAGKQAELSVIQKGGYNSKASLSASASATNKSVNNLTGQLTEEGIENIVNNASLVIAQRIDKLTAEISKGNGDLAAIDETNKKLATQSERTADEQDIKQNGEKISNVVRDDGDITRNKNEAAINNLLEEFKAPDRSNNINLARESEAGKALEEAMTFVTAEGQLKQLWGSDKLIEGNQGIKRYLTMVEEMEDISFDFPETKKEFKSKMETVLDESYKKIFEGLEEAIVDIQIQIDNKTAEMNKKIDKDGNIKKSARRKGYNDEDYDKDQAKIESLQTDLSNFKTYKHDTEIEYSDEKNYLKNYSDELNKINIKTNTSTTLFKKHTDVVNKDSLALENAAYQSSFLASTFDDIKNKIGYFLSLNYVFDQMTRKISEAVQTTKEMDKDMTQIGLVLGKTSGQVWKNFDNYAKMAERLNTTTSQVTNSMKLFYQQGLNTSEVNKMVEASAIAAALGESTMADASETLTSIINSYSLSANEAMMVTDKISQIAIVSAADFGELSTAIEKVASSAASAGLDLDHMMGYLAKMIETTREAPTNVGTALKTIVANFTQFKEDPSGLAEEGSEINKVDKALKSVGISLTNTNGEVRDLGEVIDELGGKWGNLDRSQKAYLATAIAGTRQQSRFYALMNDYERTLELVSEGSNSAGKAQQQFALYSESLNAATEQLTNEWEKFFSQITSGNGVIKYFTNTLTSLMKVINEIGPIGTSLGLISFITQIRKGIINIEDFSKSIEILSTKQATREKMQHAFSIYSKNNTIDNRKKLLDVAQNEGLGKLNIKNINKALKITENQKQIQNLSKEIMVSSKFSEKFGKTVTKTGIQIKNGFLKGQVAVKAFAKSLATAGLQMMAIYLAGKAISFIVDAFDRASVSAEEFAEQAEKAAENAETLTSLRNEYEGLVNTIDRTTEEEERLKEITEEVSEVSAELGNNLSNNVDAFKANIDVMDEYIARQKQIAGTNAINAALKTAQENNGFWDKVGRWLSSGFASDDEREKSDISIAKGLYGEIDSGASQQHNLDSARQNILNTYANNLMKQLESSNKTADDWYEGLLDYKAKVTAMAENLANLSSVTLKVYSQLQTDFANKDLNYAELREKIENANIDETIKQGYRNSLNAARVGSIQTVQNRTGLDTTSATNIVDSLSRESLKQIFDPDNLDVLSEEEQKQYWESIVQIFNDENLKNQLIEAVAKNGIDGLQAFINNLDESSVAALDIVQDTISGLQTLAERVETAKTAFEKLSELMSSKILTGDFSQMDLISGLLDGTYNIQDIYSIGKGSTLGLSLDTIISQTEARFQELKKPFEEQTENLQKQIDYYNNFGDNLVNDATKKLEEQQKIVDQAQQEYDVAVNKTQKDNASYEKSEQDITNRGVIAGTIAGVVGGVISAIALPIGGIVTAGAATAIGANTDKQLQDLNNERTKVTAQNQTNENTKLQELKEQQAIYNEIKNELEQAQNIKIAMVMTDEQLLQKAKENVNTWIEQNKQTEKWVSVLDEQGNEVGKVNSEVYNKNLFTDKGISLKEAKELQKDNASLAEDNVKLYEDEAKVLRELGNEASQYAEDQVNAATDIQKGYKKTLTAIEKIQEKTLGYQKTYKAVFESFSSAGQIYNELEKVADAYELCDQGAKGYFDVAQAIANDPSLIEAIDMESKYLELNKEKVVELGKTKVQEQIDELKTKLKGTDAIIGLIKAQMAAGNDQVVAEAEYTDDKGECIAAALAYNEDLTKSEEESVETEGQNLEISVANWTNWQEAILQIMQRVEDQRAELAKRIASGETVAGSTSTAKLTGIKVNYKAQTSVSADEIEKTDKEKYDSLINTITSQNTDLSAMLESYQTQRAILEKSINSLQAYKKNMASNLADIAGTSGSKDEFDPIIEKLEKFYNYLRQLEELEARLNRLREKRNLIDATKNYYIDDLVKENDLLREQQSIYNDYIRDQGAYLNELKAQIQEQFGNWAYFNENGVIQVKQTEFTANSEDEEERLNTFLELVDLYENEYNTREENINKLYEIENTQLENISASYEKILTRVEDITDALNKQIDLLDHDMNMSFSNIGKFDIMDDQTLKAVEGIKTSQGYIKDFKEEIAGLNTEVKNGPFSELLLWDETLEHWRVNEEALQDESIVAKYEKMGYNWQEIDTYVRSVATESQALDEAMEGAVDSANEFAELLKTLIEDRIDTIKDFYSASTDEFNKIFDTFENKMTDIDNQNNLFGVASDSLEDKYLTLVTATVILKQTIQDLKANKDGILEQIQKEYPEYVKMINGVAVVNKQAIEESTGLTEDQRAHLLQLYGILEASEEQIDEMEDKLVDYFNTMLEMEEAKRDAIIDLKQQVHDELIARDQQEIDDLQEKYSKMSELDNEYYSELQRRVSDAREAREQRQESANIAQMQAQLSLMRADNSGAYNAEMIELQKQLNTALQTQADNDVTRELERIQREQQEREQDRQMTIQAMENVLTFKDENSWYWQEAQRIWDEGPESITGFLRTANEYSNISDEQRAVEFENLTNNMNTAFTTLQNEAGLSDRISDGVVSNASAEMQTKLEVINNNLNFIEQQLEGKIDWANSQNMQKLQDVINDTTTAMGENAASIKANMNTLYTQEVGPGFEGINQSIEDYLGANSQIWKKLDVSEGKIGTVDGTVRTGFEDTVKAVSEARDGIVNTLNTAKREYLEKTTKLYAWIDKKYAEEVAPTINSGASKVDTQLPTTTGNGNSSSSAGGNGPGSTTAAKPDLKIGSVVSVKPGTRWYYDSYGKDPSGVATGGAIKYVNLKGSHPYNIKGLGWIKKSDIVGYSKGGYVDYTGVANVHGTAREPEAFLNAKQTRLFEMLRDGLTKTTSNRTYDKTPSEVAKEEYNIDSINIEVKELADTDSVEKITRKVKEEIYKDSTGRNNMAVRRR